VEAILLPSTQSPDAVQEGNEGERERWRENERLGVFPV
jgi:hypothetical protein